jgi:hypothetical protein
MWGRGKLEEGLTPLLDAPLFVENCSPFPFKGRGSGVHPEGFSSGDSSGDITGTITGTTLKGMGSPKVISSLL